MKNRLLFLTLLVATVYVQLYYISQLGSGIKVPTAIAIGLNIIVTILAISLSAISSWIYRLIAQLVIRPQTSSNRVPYFKMFVVAVFQLILSNIINLIAITVYHYPYSELPIFKYIVPVVLAVFLFLLMSRQLKYRNGLLASGLISLLYLVITLYSVIFGGMVTL